MSKCGPGRSASGACEAGVARDRARMGKTTLSAAPPDIATCLWHSGVEPFTRQEVSVAKGLRDRKMQRTLMQFFQPENWFTVREALVEAGRQDLTGSGCACQIPANPPKEALEARR